MTKSANPSFIRQDVSSLLRPPSRIPVADAVSKYMRVPLGGCNSVSWESGTTPYVVEPMNCLTSREYDAVVFVGPARTGKTIGLVDGWIAYAIICDPSDMLVVQLTEEKAREHSKKRLDRMFRVSPEIAKRLSSRSNDNNVHDKIFRAGNYLKIGWPSINVLSSSDYRFAAITDYDRWPDDIDGEGDGFSLASKRVTTFMSSGMTMAESSPGKDVRDLKWKPTSEHEAPPCTGILSLYNRGDRRRWYWLCPDCGNAFRPELDVMAGYQDITDPVQASESAFIQCPHCEHAITADQKRELNNAGIWIKDGQHWNKQTQQIEGEPRRSRIASFWMQGPAAGYQTWQQLVYKLLTAEQEYDRTGSEETLRTVINTDWGLPYTPKSAAEQRQSEELMARAESWPRKTIPDGVRFVLAGVDVQAGKNSRFVVQVHGYGEFGEKWLIDRFNIKRSARCDENGESLLIDPAAYPEDWHLLATDVLSKTYRLNDDSDRVMQVMAIAVDSGGEDGVTNNAYAFWRWCRSMRIHKRVFLVKGASSRSDKVVRKSYPDNTGRADRRADARGDVPLFLLQTDALKDRVTNALKRENSGANYVHFPKWLGEWFFDELTYEERGADGKWRKPGKGNNEALDTLCYCEALCIIHGYDKLNWDNPKNWALPWDSNPFVMLPDDVPVLNTTELNSPPVHSVAPARLRLSSGGWLSGGGSSGGGGWL